MKFFRKNLFPFAAFMFVAFLSILAAEAFHHHDDGVEDHDDCPLCSWQLTTSQAPSAPAPPVLGYFVSVFYIVVALTPFFVPAVVSPLNSGRSPPSILL